MLKKISSREVIFILISLVLAAAVVGVFVYTIDFLVKKIKTTAEGNSSLNAPPTKFNLEALEEIGPKKERETAPAPAASSEER